MMLDLKALESLLDPMFAEGASQNAVAKSLGLESSALSRWRNGGAASYAQVAGVAERLGVPVATLWKGEVPRKYATGVAHGTTAQAPVAAAIDAAYARGYAAAEFSAIAEAAQDIARRARVAAERMQRPAATPSGVPVEGEAAEHQAGQRRPARPRRKTPTGG